MYWDDPKPEFKWPVTIQQRIAAEAEAVWEAISTPGNLETCHPYCLKNPVTSWPGDGAIDHVHYLNGLIYERRFRRWIDGVGYELEIGEKYKTVSYVSWRVASAGAGESVLRIAVYPHLLQSIPVWVRWIPHLVYVRPLLRSYLRSVVRGFQWYMVRGEAVPRNQFGPHVWFSKPTRRNRAT